MSDGMFKIRPRVEPPAEAVEAKPEEFTGAKPPVEPIFEEGRVGIVKNSKRFVISIVWFIGALFMLVLLFSGTPYEFREDRFNGKSVAMGTSTGSLFSPPANDKRAIPHLLAGQFLIELGVLVGITGGALWALGWRPRRGDHI